MPESTVATLPDADEMMRRLIAANDEPHAVEKFYPRIVSSMADRPQTGMGVVMGLHLAVADYTVGLPPIMGRLMLDSIHLYVHALLDGTEILDEALGTLEELGLPSK